MGARTGSIRQKGWGKTVSDMILQTKGICKSFGGTKALKGIDFQLKGGGIHGLIGENGAGKSTFLRLVSGILKPEEGHVTIDHHEVFENPAVKARFFYISDEQYFFSNSTPKEMMEFYRKVYQFLWRNESKMGKQFKML